MIDYLLHAVPTFCLVLIYFIRTESRLTRIEVLLEVLMQKGGCDPGENAPGKPRIRALRSRGIP